MARVILMAILVTPDSWGSMWPIGNGSQTRKAKPTRLAEKGRGEEVELRGQEEKGGSGLCGGPVRRRGEVAGEEKKKKVRSGSLGLQELA
ncbi:hypothetical protein CRG98_037624 [Punica granatum]|uniref:Uncharacterized protein n=1 Tax=Punica granatum TaxID=22663 RepID=A0A2I0IF78_PUNGR|nr:hypothetical protein CRG98_037624 [Punica granatum]